jgi:hypothetical protein
MAVDNGDNGDSGDNSGGGDATGGGGAAGGAAGGGAGFTREICKMLFNLSKTPIRDEMSSDFHKLISWVDFLVRDQ